jgi:hypothetical protein
VEGLRARRAGDADRAQAAHHEALEGYLSAGVHRAIAFTQSCLGFLAAERGDPASAQAHHAAALDAGTAGDEPASLALALEGAATVLGDDAAESGAVLLGAAGEQWRRCADPGRQSHRDDVDAAAVRFQRLLDPTVFAAARDRGAGTGRDEAIRIARAALTTPQ